MEARQPTASYLTFNHKLNILGSILAILTIPMPPTSSTSLKITDPLVLYRSLLATKRINPDPAQHRLALHLRKIYQRLKDYEPNVEYKHHIERLGYATGNPFTHKVEDGLVSKGIKFSFGASSKKSESLALVQKLTDHESALRIQSPQGLLLYGEVGTGKTMLVDLLAESLPTRLKRRWHFNTFILEAFSELEQLRVARSHQGNSGSINSGMSLEGDSLLWLAREMISTSPILFLDEFQLPDRAATRILSSLFTSFFHLGGVLIATSNRMPEELAKASGADFIAPRKSFLTSQLLGTREEEAPKAREDSNAFLQVLV